MFESDDFDQILSQFELPVAASSNVDQDCCKGKNVKNIDETRELSDNKQVVDYSEACINNATVTKNISDIQTSQNVVSVLHTKRKIIDSYFDQKSKRKFPGPAGLLTGNFQDNQDTEMCQIELLSQTKF
ncbi:unnamed protein product [Diatraea saccharalis]|uniref:Uncharacterized protein n=1 Tax=Diatraea saccharalis TaxID=40085 RepID=A0A9N9WEK2_9NEOP|nr:unnamed protein product [Diatraea saccharalis]